VPLAAWAELGWPLLALCLLVLLLRRMPVIALLAPALGPRLDRRDVAFLAWFGPIGVAAIYYAAAALRHSGEAVVWQATSAIVLASIVAHGLSAAPLTRRYGERSDPDLEED
jgi:sodium/hydrogen antiporter